MCVEGKQRRIGFILIRASKGPLFYLPLFSASVTSCAGQHEWPLLELYSLPAATHSSGRVMFSVGTDFGLLGLWKTDSKKPGSDVLTDHFTKHLREHTSLL